MEKINGIENISKKAIELTVKEVCKKYFNFDFDSLNIPVKINGRLKNSLGRMVYNPRLNKAISIEFSKELVSGIYKIETVESVIKHECTHLVLFTRKESFKDGCKNFEDTVKKIGGTSTGTIFPAGIRYHGICSKCGEECLNTTSKARFNRITDPENAKFYVSGCCHSPIVKGENEIIKDNTEFKNKDAGELLRKNIELANGKKEIAKKIVAKKAADKIKKPADKIEKPIEDNEIKIDPITHLIAPKNGKIKVNQTALWRTLIYYVDTKNDAEIKFLYKNFKEDFIKGYKCLTKNRIKYIDMIVKVEA